jgi:anti-sigma-K factor RskA
LNIHDIISSGLLELYAVGLASPKETAQVEEWIKLYPEVASEFEKIKSVSIELGQANVFIPDSELKERLFAKLDSLEQPSVVSIATSEIKFRNRLKWVAVAAAIALLIGSTIMNISLYRYNKDMQFAMDIVQSKYCQPVLLPGMSIAPSASAKVFWMKNTGDVYIDASNLPTLPPGKQYQFWATVNGKIIDGGMISTLNNSSKNKIQKMKSFDKAEAFDITIEKEGGSPTPTKSQMIVMGRT